ncbi:TPA: ATP-binding protein, partial [Candidatus Micrarchaeota archaeon]|nr:ATP-binding protein [Candidatus Micrarchaeota archaeon]
MAVMEYLGFSLSREKLVVRRDRQKAFDKFGLQDLGDSKGVDSLEDIGGYEGVKRELREAIIAPLKSQEITYTYGLEPPNGVLLFGPPGTGKTMMMKALAKEMNIGFYYVKCSELLSEWYGESEKNISEV